jgi:O-antigen/teichoic acid export membrane protein
MKKGLILHLLAILAFALSAVILHVTLGRILPMERYGVVGLILNLVNINYLFVHNGVRQAVSIFMARQVYDRADLVKKSAALQLATGLMLFVLNFSGAGIMARLLGDPSLEKYIGQTAAIIPFMAMYFLWLGLLNGERRFGAESGLTALYPLLRLISIPLILTLPSQDSVSLVIGGLLFAGFSTSLVGGTMVVSRAERQEGALKISLREIVDKSLPLLFFYAGATLLMNVDTILLKRITHDDQVVGLYTAASSFSKLIYFASVPVVAVVIPNLSKSYHGHDETEAKVTLLKGLDFFIVIMAPLLVVLAASGRHLFSILYSPRYAAAGDIFAVLVPAILFLSMAVYLNTVLHAVRSVKNSMLMVYLLAVNLGLNFLLVPKLGSIGSGVALLIVSVFGLSAVSLAIHPVFPWTLDVAQIGKRGFLIGAMLLLSMLVYRHMSPPNIYWLGGSYVMLFCCCAALVWSLGFFTSRDVMDVWRSFVGRSDLRR